MKLTAMEIRILISKVWKLMRVSLLEKKGLGDQLQLFITQTINPVLDKYLIEKVIISNHSEGSECRKTILLLYLEP